MVAVHRQGAPGIRLGSVVGTPAIAVEKRARRASVHVEQCRQGTHTHTRTHTHTHLHVTFPEKDTETTHEVIRGILRAVRCALCAVRARVCGVCGERSVRERVNV